MAGEDKIFQPPFFCLDFKAKNMKPEKAFASYRICSASYFAAMPQNTSYAERRASPNPDQPFQMKQLRYEAFSVSLQI